MDESRGIFRICSLGLENGTHSWVTGVKRSEEKHFFADSGMSFSIRLLGNNLIKIELFSVSISEFQLPTRKEVECDFYK